MSTELAITAVTQSLRDVLSKGISQTWGSDVLSGELQKQLFVEALPPHKVRDHHATENVVNIFLYRVDVNAAWRNQALPAAGNSAATAMPPLALNLEYLLTAYGEDDREEVAHYFLAQAMRVLHDTALVPRQKLFDILKKARVQDQIERITVSPKGLSVDDISKLFFQTHFRLSAGYLVTVVLIDSQTPSRSALPVLTRGKDDSGVQTVASALPLLNSAAPATGFGAARLGESLIVTGQRLDTTGLTALLRHPFMPVPMELPVTPVSATQVSVAIPAATPGSGVSAAWPAGIYSLSLKVTPSSLPAFTSNDVPFLLAPSITVAPPTLQPPAKFDLTIIATPQLHGSQTAVVLFDDTQLTPKSISAPAGPDDTTTYVAEVAAAIALAGMHRVRLRVDGIDSIPIKTTAGGFAFDDAQSVEVKP